jgi:hypothetical protein
MAKQNTRKFIKLVLSQDGQLDSVLDPNIGVHLIELLKSNIDLNQVNIFMREKSNFLRNKGYYPKVDTTGAFIYGCYFSVDPNKYCQNICINSLPDLSDDNQRCNPIPEPIPEPLPVPLPEPPGGSCPIPAPGPALKPVIMMNVVWNFPTTVAKKTDTKVNTVNNTNTSNVTSIWQSLGLQVA